MKCKVRQIAGCNDKTCLTILHNRMPLSSSLSEVDSLFQYSLLLPHVVTPVEMVARCTRAYAATPTSKWPQHRTREARCCTSGKSIEILVPRKT